MIETEPLIPAHPHPNLAGIVSIRVNGAPFSPSCSGKSWASYTCPLVPSYPTHNAVVSLGRCADALNPVTSYSLHCYHPTPSHRLLLTSFTQQPPTVLPACTVQNCRQFFTQQFRRHKTLQWFFTTIRITLQFLPWVRRSCVFEPCLPLGVHSLMLFTFSTHSGHKDPPAVPSQSRLVPASGLVLTVPPSSYGWLQTVKTVLKAVFTAQCSRAHSPEALSSFASILRFTQHLLLPSLVYCSHPTPP